MRVDTQHWHVAVTCAGYQDGYEDQSFEDVDGALDYANQTRDAFQEDGLQVIEVDRSDDDQIGVIGRYHAAEGEEMIAVVEVHPCYKAGCRPLSSPFRSSSASAGSKWSRVFYPKNTSGHAGVAVVLRRLLGSSG